MESAALEVKPRNDCNDLIYGYTGWAFSSVVRLNINLFRLILT